MNFKISLFFQMNFNDCLKQTCLESTCVFIETSSKNGVFFIPKIMNKWLNTCSKTNTKNDDFFDHIWIDLGVPAGSQNGIKTRPRKKLDWNFSGRKSIFCIFFARTRSGRVPDWFWRLRGPSRTGFWDDFAILFCCFRRDLVGVCRVPPGCCRDPHPTSVTHLPGFLWGTAIREAV